MTFDFIILFENSCILIPKEYQLQQEEAQSEQFPLGPFCNQAFQAASVNFSGKGPKREQGGQTMGPKSLYLGLQ